MKTILFVCMGNLCRSPMAEGLLRRKLEREGLLKEYRVRSAGVCAVEGAPASPDAVRVMAERGVDISGHRAHDLTPADVEEATLILTMTPSHAESIRREFPRQARKVYTLAEMAGRSYGVDDPYGGSLSEYRRCADEIERLIEEGYRRIVQLAGGTSP